MRTPKGPRNWFSRCCKKSQALYDDHRAIRWVLVPAFVYLPSAIIAAGYSTPEFADAIYEQLPEKCQLAVRAIARDFVVFWVLLAGAWPLLWNKVGSSVLKQNQSSVLSVDGLLALISTIEAVVAKKYIRFYRAVQNSRLSKDQVFEDITQPLTQIEELVRGICDFFNIIRTDAQRGNLIRVTMVGVKDKNVAQILLHYPTDEAPRADMSVLGNPQSTFSIALRTKRMIIIPDIAKELKKGLNKRRFVESPVQEDNVGSLICYPIKCRSSSQVPYLIAVHCDEPKYFSENFRELYEHTLDRFEARINVEHNLMLLKERFK